MTEQQLPLERLVAGWMADEAAGAPELLLDQILATTARSKSQPRWRALLAEPTMRGRSARTAVGLPNRGLAFVAIALLLLAGLAALAVGASLLLTQNPPPARADWPGFRGDAARTGIGIEGPTGNPRTLWTVHGTGAVLEVVVIGDRVFFASDDGRLHAVSRDQGVERWTVSAGDSPLTGPYAADGRLYLSDASGRFRAFSQIDGTAIWVAAATYATPSRAVSADGTLYFGTADGFIVALDGTTGAERWRVRPAGATHVYAPAVDAGRIYAGTDGGGFVAVDAASHQATWTAATGADNPGSATVIDGIAYIGVAAYQDSVGTLHAFDAATGAPRWTATDPFLGIPTVANGVAYSASTHGLLEAIDTSSGRPGWKVQLAEDLRSPVVVGGTLYVVASSAHRVYAVDAATGDELWAVDLDANANCCVSVARGAVFVGDQAGSVYAIGGDGAALAGRPFPSVQASPSRPAPSSGGPTPTPLPTIASVTWSTDLRGMGFAPISQIAVDPKGRIWAPEASADRIAIFSPDGSLIEEWGASGDGPGQFDFTRGNGDGYGTVAFAQDGSFYVLDVGHRRVQRFDAQRRFVRAWGSLGLGPGQFSDPVGIAVAADGSVWVLDDVRGVLEHFDVGGNVLGSIDPFASTPDNNGANSLAIDSAGNFFVSLAGPNRVVELDPTGAFVRFIGDRDFADQPSHVAIDRDGRLFVTQGPHRAGAGGILAFGPDGSLIGDFGPEGDGDGLLVFPAGVALGGSGSLYVEDSVAESARLIRLELLPGFRP